MTVPADIDDKWLHRLILEVELTEDNQIHPAAWERFKPSARVPQWSYVLSGTSSKLGNNNFMHNANNAVARYNRNRAPADYAAYRGLIYQLVQNIRQSSGALQLDVYIVEDRRDPSHAILVTTTQIKTEDGSVSPDVAMKLNKLFILALPGTPEENHALS